MTLLLQRGGAPLISLPQPGESKSQYVPHVVQVANGDLWMIVKGDESREIRGYRSTDAGATFVYEGPVIQPTPGAWDSFYCDNPAMIRIGSTIHYYYKAHTQPGYGGMGIGYATAPASDPLSVTKHPANPILTQTKMLAAYGSRFGLTGIQDMGISDVMLDQSGVVTFWGFFQGQAGTPYRIFRCRVNAGMHEIDPYQEGIVEPLAPNTFVQCPSVFKEAGRYVMLFTEGHDSGMPGDLHHTAAWCLPDGNWAWQRYPLTFLHSGGLGAWDSGKAYAGSLLKTGAKHDAPLVIDGAWQFYYSGCPLSATNTATSGLARLMPVELLAL